MARIDNQIHKKHLCLHEKHDEDGNIALTAFKPFDGSNRSNTASFPEPEKTKLIDMCYWMRTNECCASQKYEDVASKVAFQVQSDQYFEII